MINLHLPSRTETLRPSITVIGVGGAGGNAVNNMIAAKLEGVNFVIANTDAQALDNSLTDRTIQLGASITRGLGAGASPEVGRAAAEEAIEEIAANIQGSNMVFITAGMGGGTGTGAAPVVARMAREQGVLTVAVVTKPFQFEGTHRMKMAEAGLTELQNYVDTLIVIPNQNLFRVANEKTTFADAFRMADEVLHSGVRGVTDLMVKPGLVNLDFADIRTVMREMGKAMMGTGEATGERRAVEAAEAAISNPLLDDVSLKGARAVLINITGGMDMTLYEVDEAANRIRDEVDSEANIIFGSTFHEEMEGRMRVSVVATGIDALASAAPRYTPMQQPEQRRPYTFTSAPRPEVQRMNKPVAPTVRETPKVPETQSYAPQAEPSRERYGAPASSRPADFSESFDFMQAPSSRQQETAEQTSALAPPREAPASMVEAKFNSAPAVPAQKQQFGTRQAADEQPMSAPRRPREREEGTSFFGKVAGVGRAFSAKMEEAVAAARPEPVAERSLQVVERQKPEVIEHKQPTTQDDQYLEIPAFLRRQAN